MQSIQPAVAGTLESGDIQVSIYPNPGQDLEIQLQSIVRSQFGEAILATTKEVLKEFGLTQAVVSLVDKGALDWVIRSRVQAACCRATQSQFTWKDED
jgi:citrate lyase subunit gamma (acyl carrier protein)